MVATPSAAAIVLCRGGLAGGLSPRRSARVAVIFGVVWAAWVGASAALAADGVHHDPDAAVPWLGIAAFAAALLAARFPGPARILATSATTMRPAWPHAVRVVGVLF